VGASIRQDASDAFGRGGELQVVPNGEQDDVTREAMTLHQAGRVGRGVPTARAADVNWTTTLIVAIPTDIG